MILDAPAAASHSGSGSEEGVEKSGLHTDESFISGEDAESDIISDKSSELLS